MSAKTGGSGSSSSSSRRREIVAAAAAAAVSPEREEEGEEVDTEPEEDDIYQERVLPPSLMAESTAPAAPSDIAALEVSKNYRAQLRRRHSIAERAMARVTTEEPEFSRAFIYSNSDLSKVFWKSRAVRVRANFDRDNNVGRDYIETIRRMAREFIRSGDYLAEMEKFAAAESAREERRARRQRIAGYEEHQRQQQEQSHEGQPTARVIRRMGDAMRRRSEGEPLQSITDYVRRPPALKRARRNEPLSAAAAAPSPQRAPQVQQQQPASEIPIISAAEVTAAHAVEHFQPPAHRPAAVEAASITLHGREITDDWIGDEVSVQEIERKFARKGIEPSGLLCPVCMCPTPPEKMTRFTSNCSHWYCRECAIAWKNSQVVSAPAICPGCIAEAVSLGPAHIKYNVDPRVMAGDPNSLEKMSTIKDVRFCAAQLAALQKELMEEEHEDHLQQSVCPLCSNVGAGSSKIARCGNPHCAIQYCSRCFETCFDPKAKKFHQDGKCATVDSKTMDAIQGAGTKRCVKCKAVMWHAMGHHCHHVTCNMCKTQQCFACGALMPGGVQKCACPIFCDKKRMDCGCAETCFECAALGRPCSLCEGNCPVCMKRKSSQAH